jgi:hypothetical protein
MGAGVRSGHRGRVGPGQCRASEQLRGMVSEMLSKPMRHLGTAGGGGSPLLRMERGHWQIFASTGGCRCDSVARVWRT